MKALPPENLPQNVQTKRLWSSLLENTNPDRVQDAYTDAGQRVMPIITNLEPLMLAIWHMAQWSLDLNFHAKSQRRLAMAFVAEEGGKLGPVLETFGVALELISDRISHDHKPESAGYFNPMDHTTIKPTTREARVEGLNRLVHIEHPSTNLTNCPPRGRLYDHTSGLISYLCGRRDHCGEVDTDGWNVELWMQYGEQATPFARTSLPALTPGQPYDVLLSLQVPLTPENLALGNFMTKLILTDAKNSTVATANRPSLVLRERSSWIPFLKHSPQTETIVVPLLDHWSPSSQPGNLLNHGVAVARGTSHMGFHAFVAVGRPDAWKSIGSGQGKELSIARATLQGHVKLHGIRGFFARHKHLLFTLTTVVFFVASTGAALIFYLVLAPSLSEGDNTGVDTKPLIQEQGTQTTPRMRFKDYDTEPPSTSETEYSWTSGGPGSRIKVESDEDETSTE
ncbi:adipose-regulatory protein (Seipin) [Rhizoctonia solani]|uniref:Adipose-regulatory protein (Seipin) n=1 Tax=Rhizoctonia solani TaxID=456999 RepID=A0A8H8NVK6_9AGAM|nr:adipose-regulatory protein (Seipin) [Rhizoctonia solani]QRW18947.1 adipose-regulatory protein (Seipin) [Rhizoctonia solani]